MAVRTACPHCDKKFSAPEDYLGKKIDCPHCGRRSVLRSREEVEQESQLLSDEKKRLDEDREKIALIEKIESRTAKRSGAPYYHEYQTGVHAVRHFNPKAPSRFLRLRALADFLVLGAYVELFLVAVGVGLTFYLWIQGVIPTTSIFVLLVIAWTMIGTAFFFVFKLLGELALLFAEMGDQQNSLVQLLLDLRESTDARKATE